VLITARNDDRLHPETAGVLATGTDVS